jgi:alpha-beta hydrolase superfamily lysophospholipase
MAAEQAEQIPDGGLVDRTTVADGTTLHLRHWPSAGRPRATLLIVHGIAEHGGRYDRTARIAAEAGLDVRSFDLRGHGNSSGQPMYVERWSRFLDDLEGRVAAARETGLPLVLMGHSMGALIALTSMLDGRPAPDLLVLSAPPLGATVPAWQRLAAPILSVLLPRMTIPNPIDGAQLSRDPEVGRAYFADPLVRPFSTPRLGNELFGAMKRARATLPHLDERGVPTLVIHGGDDALVPTRLSEPLGRLACVERRVLPGLRHESLNEPEGPEVAAQIVAWVRGRLAPR